MNVIVEVLEELWSMFAGDRRLTLLVLVVVAVAAAVALLLPKLQALAPLLLLMGALAVLADSVFQAARKARRKP
jgi:hypothetical protein